MKGTKRDNTLIFPYLAPAKDLLPHGTGIYDIFDPDNHTYSGVVDLVTNTVRADDAHIMRDIISELTESGIVLYHLISMVILSVQPKHVRYRYAGIMAERSYRHVDIADVKSWYDHDWFILDESGKTLVCDIPTYLVVSTKSDEISHKLINQDVHNGMVYVSYKRFRRLYRQWLMNSILGIIDGLDLPHDITKPYRYLVPHKHIPYGNNTNAGTPPCIKESIRLLSEGYNLNNFGRFTLAVWATNRDVDDHTIIEWFESAPDFDRNITMSKIQQIKRRGYACSGCDKIKTNSPMICKPDTRCREITNPISYSKL